MYQCCGVCFIRSKLNKQSYNDVTLNPVISSTFIFLGSENSSVPAQVSQVIPEARPRSQRSAGPTIKRCGTSSARKSEGCTSGRPPLPSWHATLAFSLGWGPFSSTGWWRSVRYTGFIEKRSTWPLISSTDTLAQQRTCQRPEFNWSVSAKYKLFIFRVHMIQWSFWFNDVFG